MLKTALVLSCIAALCFCAVSRERANPKAEKGTCLSSNKDVGVMKSGETKSMPNVCAEVLCFADGSLSYHSCGTVSFEGKRCYNEDLSKPYPDCCPTIPC